MPKHLINVANILRGALTSLLIFVCDGLNPITKRLSTLLSEMRKSLDNAINVDIFVYFPLNKLCCKSHLSINIFSPILFSIENDDKKSITLLTLDCISLLTLNWFYLVVPKFINLEYTNTNDCMTLGVLDLKTFNTISWSISLWFFFSNLSKSKMIKLPA